MRFLLFLYVLKMWYENLKKFHKLKKEAHKNHDLELKHNK